jgi:hypothetical protein
MIDAREPKDGDYASYVESMVNAPKAQKLPAEPPADAWGRQAGGQPPRADQGPAATRSGAGSAQQRLPRTPAPGAQHGEARRHVHETLEARLEQLRLALPDASAGGLAQLLRRAATFASVIGIALVVLSFSNDPPFFANPGFGMLLVVLGAVLRRVAKNLR